MPRLMDLGLEQLTNMVLDMAELAEKTVLDSLDVYQAKGANSDSIFQLSEQLSMLRDSANDLAVELLARYQPLAGDLRYIKSCIDIAYDLSRFGRYAYDIAITPRWLGELSSCNVEVPLDIADKVMAMIKKSIVAFKNKDVQLARTLATDDDLIDQKYIETLTNLVKAKKTEVKCVIAVTLLLRHIERIGDHACYIADSVIYIVEGKREATHSWRG